MMMILIAKSEKEKRACIVIGDIITIGFSFLTILFVNCNQKKIWSLKSKPTIFDQEIVDNVLFVISLFLAIALSWKHLYPMFFYTHLPFFMSHFSLSTHHYLNYSYIPFPCKHMEVI